jgi:hypothetical protein
LVLRMLDDNKLIFFFYHLIIVLFVFVAAVDVLIQT